MFLQIHNLVSYHATLLNRDDAGLAKRISFGGYERLRVSSQCLKRHWREWIATQTDLPGAIRTRHFFSREIKRRLVESGMDETLAHDLTFHLGKVLLSSKSEGLDEETLVMKQPALFGKPEADYLVQILEAASKQGSPDAAKKYIDEKLKVESDNFKAMVAQAGLGNIPAGIDGAMFGRFVTSDILSREDAPVHVAHAMTTHVLDTTVDFFTVVDDLRNDDETGAAHANDMELGAGVFYGYVSVDIPLLVSNLTGCERTEWRAQDPESARILLDRLVHAIAEVSPGAKLGATAPFARAEHLVLECGTAQPRTLSNAFLEPVRMGKGNPLSCSAKAMAVYLDSLERMYGNTGERRYVSTIHEWTREGDQVLGLQEGIARVLDDIFGDSRS